MTIKAEDFHVVTFRGDDEGNKCSDGDYWWAYCEDLDLYIHAELNENIARIAVEAIAEHLEFMEEIGSTIPKPRQLPEKPKFSGKFLLRMSPYDHEELYYEAKRHNMSLNSLMNRIVDRRNGARAAIEQMQGIVAQVAQTVVVGAPVNSLQMEQQEAGFYTYTVDAPTLTTLQGVG